MKHKLAAVLSTLVLSFCLLASPTLTQDAVEITAVQWSPDGSMLAAGLNDGSVQIRSANNELLFNIAASDEPVFVVAWSPDGTKLATGGLEDRFDVWNISGADSAMGSNLFSWQIASISIGAIAWHEDGNKIAVGAEGSDGPAANLLIFDLQKKSPINHLFGGGVSDLSWHPHEIDLITLGDMAGLFELSYAYETAFNPPIIPDRFRIGPHDYVSEVSWHPDGTVLAVGLDNGLIYLLDGTTHQRIIEWQLHQDFVSAIDWHPSGDYIATASRDDTLKIIDVRDGHVLETYTLFRQGFTNNIDWSPDGMTLAYGDVGSLPILLHPFGETAPLTPLPEVTATTND
jgi:dipeptidyl aminopeptidase/acylaminoacyl peptidase